MTYTEHSVLRAGRSLMAAACIMISACGGGDEADPSRAASTDRAATSLAMTAEPAASRTALSAAAADPVATAASEITAISEFDAHRFLTQASFGPNSASISDVRSKGYSQWIDSQMLAAWSPLSQSVEASASARQSSTTTPSQSGTTTPSAKRVDVLSAFWREALTSEAQLRWRVAFALSQVFVASLDSGAGTTDPIGAADYYDMLARNAFGNYRTLLESVALHPMMGRYLTHLGNRKADPTIGRMPDENFAREVLQLFSIGLYELKPNGQLKKDTNDQPIPTYSNDDVSELAKVFTGFGWDCDVAESAACFRAPFSLQSDTSVGTRPMEAFAEEHSTEEKRFLGTVIAPQTSADPRASLRVALDSIAAHPNVGPFIARQLIQRLVTSNPTPKYVAAVASKFEDNGMGVRGDLGAVIRAILLDPAARTAGATSGKLKEPVLRVTAAARAFGATSVSGSFDVLWDEDPAYSIGQIPYAPTSVFNFYRPGYVPPNTALADNNMVAPEMQIAEDASTAGYVNFMARLVGNGFGRSVGGVRDIQLHLDDLIGLSDSSDELIDAVFVRLLGDTSHYDLRNDIREALLSLPVPAYNPKNDNSAGIAKARWKRVRTAVLLVLVSPEFVVQE